MRAVHAQLQASTEFSVSLILGKPAVCKKILGKSFVYIIGTFSNGFFNYGFCISFGKLVLLGKDVEE